MADQVPHLRFPLTVVNGHFATVEQDSLDDIAQCTAAILRTRRGHSDQLPGMGLTMQEFYEGGADLEEIDQQLSEHEPRIPILISEDPDRLDEALSLVGVKLVR